MKVLHAAALTAALVVAAASVTRKVGDSDEVIYSIRPVDLAAEPPCGQGYRKYELCFASSVEMANDTTLRVITTYGYKTAPAILPDSTRIKVGLAGDTAILAHWNKWPKQVDTSLVKISGGYGTTFSGSSCAAPRTGTTTAAEKCVPWQFVRPAAKPSPYDTMVVKLTVLPDGIQVDPDVSAICARWQQSNPGLTPWITVNVKAVPTCTGLNGKPTVALFCAFATLKDGRKVKTSASDSLAYAANPKNWEYCDSLFHQWSGTPLPGTLPQS